MAHRINEVHFESMRIQTDNQSNTITINLDMVARKIPSSLVNLEEMIVNNYLEKIGMLISINDILRLHYPERLI